MIKNILIALTLATGLNVYAQEPDFCTTHSLSDEVLANNPAQKITYDQLNDKVESFIQNKRLQRASSAAAVGTEKVIPVVFHIIHDYNSSYLSEEQVASAVENINLDFQKQNADTIDIIPEFQDIADDLNLTFRLAKLDPNGNCTKGVTRTYSDLTNTAGENVKALVKWDPSKYLNVWIVETIASGAGGYSYIPGTAPGFDSNAGIVVTHNQFGATGTSNGSGFSRHTLSHEIGHYLGLRHTWGGTNSPGDATNCGSDDGVEDTPQCIGQSFNCDLTIATCDGNLDNVQNIMCYAGCPNMFTTGQGERIHAYLNTHTTSNAPRRNLWQQSNLIATGTNDGYTEQECLPIADIFNKNTTTCVNQNLPIKGYVYNVNNVDITWETPGAINPTATGESINVKYTEPGYYQVKLIATNSAGVATVEKTDYILVKNTTNATPLPFYSDFESTLDVNTPSLDNSWYTSSDYSEQWEESNSGENSNKGYKARTLNFDGLGQATLELPVLDFTDAASGVKLYFSYAYNKRGPSVEDRLLVYFTKNCGVHWQKRKTISTANLVTSSGSNPSWVPTQASDWVQTSVNLAPGIGIEDLQVKFVLEGEGGSYVYIDNIEIHSFPVGTEEYELSSNSLDIYPNPITDQSVIEINTEINNTFTVSVTNVLGQSIFQLSQVADLEQTIIDMPNSLQKGVYFVNLNIDGKQTTRKIQIQ